MFVYLSEYTYNLLVRVCFFNPINQGIPNTFHHKKNQIKIMVEKTNKKLKEIILFFTYNILILLLHSVVNMVIIVVFMNASL